MSWAKDETLRVQREAEAVKEIREEVEAACAKDDREGALASYDGSGDFVDPEYCDSNHGPGGRHSHGDRYCRYCGQEQ
jgi:hypothetical protein